MYRNVLLLLLLSLPAASIAGSSADGVPPGPLADALALVEANRVQDALKALGALQPGFGALGPYHFVHGKAFSASGNPLEGASHYRRAYIYATDPALRENALFLAAQAEHGMGYQAEAMGDFSIFLKKFPDSPRAGKVRILLARSLAEGGRLREALRQFDLCGNGAEALYGKANTLQRMGNTRDASRAYAAAAAADPRFPGASEETRLWLGENLRLSGESARAKDLLRTVTGVRNRDLAAVGLGEIASSESRNDEAMRLFGGVLSSTDRKVRRVALLRMADMEAAAGKTREASARLEEIVAKYPHSREHDEAILRLARLRAKAGEEASALSLFTKLVLRSSPLRKEALDGIEAILLAARGSGAARFVGLWNAGGRWLMDTSREASLVVIAGSLQGTGTPYLELVRWLSRYGTGSVRARFLTLLAQECAAAGDAAGIRECLKSLKEMNARDEEILRVEAGLKFAEKDYRGAAGSLLSLRKVEERDVGMLVETLPYAEDPGKAMSVLEAAVFRHGGDPLALTRLADALFDAGRKADAVRYYRMAAERDPASEWACYRLAVLLGRDGGEEYLKRIKTDPTLARMARAVKKEMALNAR